jgi:WD40 repeat protein
LDKLPTWLRKVPRVEDTWASLIQTLAGHSGWVHAVAFSPDGKRIASGSTDQTIKLWDATTGNLQKTLAGRSSWVDAVAFSPDGKRIASGSYDNTIKLWDATTGDLQKTLAGHSDTVNTLAFSPDGKQIASGSYDQTIKLWDVAKCLKASKLFGSAFSSRLKFHSCEEDIKVSGPIYSLKFSSGQYLLTDVGPIRVKSILADRQGAGRESLEDLHVRNQWIYYGAAPVLRLPSDFQPQCYDMQGNQVAIGFRNGRVLSFDIDRRNLQSVLGYYSRYYC